MQTKKSRFGFGVRFGEIIAGYPALIHALGLVALFVSLFYLLMRILFTFDGANLFSTLVLLAAEVFGFVSLALFMFGSWNVREANPPAPSDLTCDIVIATYNEDAVILEPTIVGSLRVNGVSRVWVLDDGRRPEVEALCVELGAVYVKRENNAHAKAGNINNALPQFDADLLLFLDADHVPSRTAITRMSGYFADETVAAVQSTQGFRNMDSMQHRSEKRHEQSLFFEVLLPGREDSESVFWCGSAAILRRRALLEIGGLATESVAEDLHTSLRLQLAGWSIKYHNEILVTGLAPHTPAEFLIQRDRWARGTIQLFFSKESPIFGRGWKPRQRASYLGSLLYYFIPVQHTAFIVVLLLALIFNLSPIGNVNPWFFALMGLNIALNILAALAFSRGRRNASEGNEFNWLVARTHVSALFNSLLRRRISFKVTPKVASQLSMSEKLQLLAIPILMTLLLIFSLTWRVLHETTGFHLFGVELVGQMSGLTLAAAAVFAGLELFGLAPMIIRELSRVQYRALWRFTVDLPGNIGDSSIRIKDLHESGMSFISSSPIAEMENSAAFSFETRDDNENVTIIGGVFHVRRASRSAGVYKWAGGIEWNSKNDRWNAQDYCYSKVARDRLTQTNLSGVGDGNQKN